MNTGGTTGSGDGVEGTVSARSVRDTTFFGTTLAFPVFFFSFFFFAAACFFFYAAFSRFKPSLSQKAAWCATCRALGELRGR